MPASFGRYVSQDPFRKADTPLVFQTVYLIQHMGQTGERKAEKSNRGQEGNPDVCNNSKLLPGLEEHSSGI